MARGFDSSGGGGSDRSRFDIAASTWDIDSTFTLVTKAYGTGVNVDGCCFFAISDGNGPGHAGIFWDTSIYVNGRIQYQVWGGSGESRWCLDDTDFIQSRWYSVVARTDGASDHELDVYDLTADRTSNSTDFGSPFDTELANAYASQGGVAGETNRGMDGCWAETAIWTVKLTDAEVVEYQAGICPLLIRPQSLLFYDPAISGERPDQIEGIVPSVTGSLTEIPHPPGIIYPAKPWVPAWYGTGAGATYQRAITEGLKAGG